MGPASFWYWYILSKHDLFRVFKPVYTFCENMPIPSSSFTSHITGENLKRTLAFPNNIETYYMINGDEDTIYGWSQDTAFCYQSLRHLTEKTTKSHFQEGAAVDRTGYLYTLNPDKKPRPSSSKNTITIPVRNQIAGTQYTVRWYDSETGQEMVPERTTAIVKQDGSSNTISFEFPSSIRDLNKRIINNTFGDAVFVICRQQDTKDNGSTSNDDATKNKKKKSSLCLKSRP